ncbi:MAG TPA: arylsulfatase [Bryobacteraceae bacterium]|nr:arylsulfatase [Bryobacteraceae bacterium]
MLQRRHFLAMTGAAFAANAAASRPNIVFILLDDLGWGDLGCYRQKLIETPNIDALARESMRFTDCYAGGSVCAPSRSVLMTGLHGGHTPVRANAGTVPLRHEDFTIAEMLKKTGYATGCFGKWGLGDAGSAGAATRQGFDEFFGYLHQVHAHDYWTPFLRDGEKRLELPANSEGKRGVYSSDLIHSRALDFLRKHRSRPYFLYAAYTLPHARLEPPDDSPYSKRDWPQLYKNYAAMVTRADRQVGELLRAIDRENTVVFLASDNGGEGDKVDFFHSNANFRGRKASLYEGGIRVPMIVHWPGRVRAGSISPCAWSFCDMMPTLAEIVGVKPPDGIDGVSVLPTLLGRTQPVRSLYWEQYSFDRRTNDLRPESLQQAARIGSWKAVRRKPEGAVELYRLDEDPGETHDVAAQHRARVEEMESYMRGAHIPPRPHNTGNMQFVVS